MKTGQIMTSQSGKKLKLNKLYSRLFPFILLAPVVIYMIVALLIPFFYGVGISFTEKLIGKQGTFNGLENYIVLLKNKEFLSSIKNTFVYTLVSVTLKVVLGVIMALVLNSSIKLKSISRGLLLIPWAVPTVVSIFTWKWLYSDVGGVLNAILMGVGLIHTQIAWLSTPIMAMISVVLVNIWRGIPFIGISVLSGLQAVSQEMYEAAMIDGANEWKRFYYITLPSIANVLMLSALVTTIWTFNDFEIIWLLTKGGPVNSTQVISTFSYYTGILKMNLSQATAASIMFMPLMIILVNLVTSRTLDKKGER